MDQRVHNSQRLILLSVYWQWVKLNQQTYQHDSNREHHLVWGTASHNPAAAPLIASLRILMAYVKSLLWGFRCTFGWWITTRKPHQTRPQVFKLYIQILTGWWFDSTPLKNMKVSWDDDIPNIWKVIKFMFQTTNQLNIPPTNYCTGHTCPSEPNRKQHSSKRLEQSGWLCRLPAALAPAPGPAQGLPVDLNLKHNALQWIDLARMERPWCENSIRWYKYIYIYSYACVPLMSFNYADYITSLHIFSNCFWIDQIFIDISSHIQLNEEHDVKKHFREFSDCLKPFQARMEQRKVNKNHGTTNI